MASQETLDVSNRAKRINEERLRGGLETNEQGRFVAIEPDSGDYFLGRTMSEAIQASRPVHPDRLAFVIRIGHATAVEIGGGATAPILLG